MNSIKYLVLINLLGLFFAETGLAQDYVIIHVRGEILRDSNGKSIKRGEKVGAEEKIQFSSPQSMAAAIASDRGRVILKPGSSSTSSNNDLIYVLKNAVTPMRGRMSTRAGGINNAMDFEAFFGNQFAFFNGNLKIKVGRVFPMDDNHFFYIQYDFRQEKINKKLTSIQDTLVINRTALLTVDDTPISSDEAENFILYYYDAEKQSSRKISACNFYLISNEESKALAESLSADEEMDQQDLFSLVSEFYGQYQESNVLSALNLQRE